MMHEQSNPRTSITYNIETGGTILKKELPFVIGILSDLSGDGIPEAQRPPLLNNDFEVIDNNNFNTLMSRLQPAIRLDAISHLLSGDDSLHLTGSLSFAALSDFEPQAIIRNIPCLNEFYQQRNQLASLVTISDAQKMQLAKMDLAIIEQINAILHAPAFRELEASWRGLHYLVFHTANSNQLQIKLLNVTLGELQQDLTINKAVDQSNFFKKLCEPVLVTYGSPPISLLIGDYSISANNDDMDFLERVAEIAAASCTPFVTAADAGLFGLPEFEVLDRPRTLGKIFEGIDLNRYVEFRQSDHSRFVTLVVPKVLLRLPYGNEALIEPAFEENVTPVNTHFLQSQISGNHYLWGNAVFLLAESIAKSFSRYHWPVAIMGEQSCGLLKNLPTHTVVKDNGEVETIGPLPVTINEERERELNELGFLPLCEATKKGEAVFFRKYNFQPAKLYISSATTHAAATAATLPYLLIACRFAHYIMQIIQNKIGSFMTRENVEAYLNTWITDYVLLDTNSSIEMQAAYPLRDAKVMVADKEGQPGAYLATLLIRPHYQLPEKNITIRLDINLPA